jgi:3-oxoacyl-[acyl-carrier protein] reductase
MKRPVALVTGGTRGIGLGIAHALARKGWDLALCGVRSPDEVQPVLDALAHAGQGAVQYVRADVSLRDKRRALVDSVVARFHGIDALINNAGRAPRVRADLLEADEDSFAELLATNLQGPYFLTQAVARVMLDRPRESSIPRSSIVFITSVSAEMASINRGEYCVSKAGLAMTANLFALRLAPHGVSVFEVRPGIIETDMTAGVRAVYDQRIAEGLVPAGRWGTPADVGAVVASLVSGDLAYATGSVIHVDGALHMPRL